MVNKTILCPNCGAEIPLVPHPSKLRRVVGYCGCLGSIRGMIETDTSVKRNRTSKTKLERRLEDGI